MALPDDVSTFTLTFGPYVNAKGEPVLAGVTGTLRPSTHLTHIATGAQVLATPITITIDAFGVASVSPLPYTDSPELSPVGFLYEVVWNLTSRAESPGNLKFAVPSDAGSTIDFDLLSPSPDVPGVVVPIGVGPAGADGSAYPLDSGDAGDTAIAALVADTGSDTGGALRAAFGRALPSAEVAALALLDRIRSHNDVTSGNIGVGAVGSSVGVGDGIDPAAQAANNPGAYLTSRLNASLDPLGHLTFEYENGSVGGAIIANFPAQYAAMKTALGYTPAVVLFVYGMNDGAAAQYHLNQTYPGVYTGLREAIKAVIADGAVPVISTTPHPHTGRMDWGAGGPVTYPATDQQVPDATTGQSIKTITVNGTPIPVSYRHYRVNEAMRAAALSAGAVLLDAEKYWFEAVAAHGEDALFAEAEFVHPNLLGHQLSYQRAIGKLIEGLTVPAVAYAAPRPAQEIVALMPGNFSRDTDELSDDPYLQFPAKIGKTYTVDVTAFYYAAVGTDMKVQFSAPSGSQGNFGTIAAGDTNTDLLGGPVTVRSSPYNSWLPVGGIDAGAVAQIHAVITAGADGVIAFQWAQMTASGDAVQMFLNSVLRARRVE